jgi:Phage tail assembly chaperone
MISLKLKANPTFRAKVAIPVPGEKPVEIEFEFLHKTRSQLEAWREQRLKAIEAGEEADDVQTVLGIVSNWFGIDGDFNEANLREFFDNYHAAPLAIGKRYGEELTQARLGN